jgi:hypothetical protein
MDDIFFVNTLLWCINNSKESQTVSNNVTLIIFVYFLKIFRENSSSMMKIGHE